MVKKYWGICFSRFSIVLLFSTQGFASEPWDLSYLLSVDPNKVTTQELYDHAVYVEDHFQKYIQVHGIVWQGIRSKPELEYPDSYGSGGDAAIWTGHYLAAATYRFLVTREEKDLDKVLQTLRGIHILTHISGSPGVIARCAFPKEGAKKWGYPEGWMSRIHDGFVYESPENIPDVLAPGKFYPQMVFYTRATRDQLIGILYGLSVVWGEVDPQQFLESANLTGKIQKARNIIGEITEALWFELRARDWRIRDQRGKNDTNADDVGGMLKLQLLSLYKEVLRIRSDVHRFKRVYGQYVDQFENSFLLDGEIADYFNVFSNIFQYYAWNLRFARAYSMFLLEDSHNRRKRQRTYIEEMLWQHVQNHQNTHFTFLYNATKEHHFEKLGEAIFSLKAFSLRPLRTYSSPLHDQDRFPNSLVSLLGDVSSYVTPAHLREPTLYFKWQEDPFDTGKGLDKTGLGEATGVDFLLPYWMGRAKGFFQ